MKFITAIFLLFCVLGHAQSARRIKTPFPVGYQNLRLTDSSRIYKSETNKNNPLYYRPVEIDCWYPSEKNNFNAPLSYGYFLNLLQERSNRFQDDTVYSQMSADLIQYLCANLHISDTVKFTRFLTKSYAGTKYLRGPFPLIMYFCSFNGMSYENVSLFEELAAQGFVVACITSVGRYPGNMSLRMDDLLEQTNDGKFAVGKINAFFKIDSMQLGVMGYSWGGLAAWELAGRDLNVRALLSLDGSEMHYYGEDTNEDSSFNLIRKDIFSKPIRNRFYVAYLESGFKQSDRIVDSIYNPLPVSDTSFRYARLRLATHEDFSELPNMGLLISGRKNTNNDSYDLTRQFSVDFFNQYLKNAEEGITYRPIQAHFKQSADLAYPVVKDLSKNTFKLTGTIYDKQTHEALEYANVGIPEKNIGTVTNRQGKFSMFVPMDFAGDSLKISLIGYVSQALAISSIKKMNGNLSITLTQKMADLNEVTVSTKIPRVKTLGNKTQSTFVSVGLPLKFLGSETGIKINLGKKRVQIKSFSFTISDNRLDSALFRINIYSYRHGTPQENLLVKPIYFPIGKKQTGRQTIQLSPYHLTMSSEIIISLEWIEGISASSGNGALFLSAAFLNSATWHRLTSQAAWKKAAGLGVGFNIDVQETADERVK